MRQLYFRFWDIKTKKFAWCNPSIEKLSLLNNTGHYQLWSTISYEVTQFTGLYDKNGKEIWEGDIVKHHPRYIASKEDMIEEDDEWTGTGLINYYPSMMGFGFKLLSGHKCTFHGPEGDEWQQDCLEVIGNKFQNPELLEGGVITGEN